MSAARISQHPFVKVSPSRWARLCDTRRMFENRRAVMEYERTKQFHCKCGQPISEKQSMCAKGTEDHHKNLDWAERE